MIKFLLLAISCLNGILWWTDWYYWMVLVSLFGVKSICKLLFPPSRQFKVEFKSNWLLWPNSDFFPPLTACVHAFPSSFSLQSHQRSRCFLAWAPPHGDVTVPMVIREPGWEGLAVVRRGRRLQRADFEHVMDPEIGHQILQAKPPGVLPNCTDTNGSRAI